MKIGATLGVSLIVAFAGASPAHAARYVWCGDDGESYNGSAGAYDIWAKRTSCTTARWLGRRWNDRAWDEEFPRNVGRFRCRALEPQPDPGQVYIGKVLCTSDGGRHAVRFASSI